MNWKDTPIPNDDEGSPIFKGLLDLTNDKNEKLGIADAGLLGVADEYAGLVPFSLII